VQGLHHIQPGDRIAVDVAMAEVEEISPEEFDAVLLPGGTLNADALRAHPMAQEFVRRMDAAGRPIAALCHGLWLLVSAGLVEGRVVTSYPTIQDDLRNAGARWLNLPVVRDRNWVSSRRPADLPSFDREMLALFAEAKARGQQAA
jgi:protease I